MEQIITRDIWGLGYCLQFTYHKKKHTHVCVQEQEGLSVREQLEQSEGMGRRLNDQVTELQGQLAIEEQRSRFCLIVTLAHCIVTIGEDSFAVCGLILCRCRL